MDISGANFESEVLQASKRLPVVVDFWAPWCAPCRALGPILEKLEREYAGRFRLAKVNSDDDQEIAGAFGVRSIPNVIAFRDGKPAAQFVGALPESQVRAFIDKLLQVEDELAKIALAEQLIERKQLDEAERLLGEVRADVDWDARVEALRAAIGFARSGAGEPELRAKLDADPADHEARLALAGLYAGNRGYAKALDELLEIVRRDRDWKDGEARRQILNIFQLAAAQPELVAEYRRKLASALY